MAWDTDVSVVAYRVKTALLPEATKAYTGGPSEERIEL